MNFKFLADDESEEMQDAIKCLQNILSIPEGSVPLNRGLGVSWSSLSDVPLEMENDFATELMEKVEIYEPRVRVNEVQFTHNEGKSEATIQVELVESEDDDEEET